MRDCPCCDHAMVESTTTFTVVKKHVAYAIEGAPCLKCPVCEYTVFDQETTRTLELLTSGRALPQKVLNFFINTWGLPIVEAGETTRAATRNETFTKAGTAIVVA